MTVKIRYEVPDINELITKSIESHGLKVKSCNVVIDQTAGRIVTYCYAEAEVENDEGNLKALAQTVVATE